MQGIVELTRSLGNKRGKYLALIAENTGGLTMSELAEITGEKQRTIRTNLKQAEELYIIKKEEGSDMVYKVSPLYTDLITTLSSLAIEYKLVLTTYGS